MSRPCTSSSGGTRRPWTSAGLSSSRAMSSGSNRGRATVPGERVARRWPTSCTDTGSSAIWSPTSIPWLEDAAHTRFSISTSSAFARRDLDRAMDCRAFRGLETAPLRELLAALERSYCGTLGVEYLSLSDKAQREWLQERIERPGAQASLTDDDRRRILERLVAAETFEQFLHAKFVGQKRFSLEGAEALIPLLDTLVEDAAAAGVDEMVMGMPHRGRLNVLAHILRKPYELILGEFEGSFLPWDVQRRRRRQVPSRLFARPHGAQRAHHPPVDERESESPRGHQSGRGRDRPRQAGVPRRCAAQARGPGAHARRRGVHGPGVGLRDAHAVGAAVLHHRRHGARHRQQPDRLHHGPRRLPRRPLSDRARAGDRRAGLPRQRRRPRGRRAGGAPGHRLSPGVRARRLRRPRLLPPPRPQRGGRSRPHSARPVQADSRASHAWLSSTVADSRRPG